MLTGYLEAVGVGLDTASLLAAARAHEDLTVRWIAIEVLGQRRVTEALPVLRRILEGEDERLLRESAALALARLGDEQGLPALLEMLAGAEEDASKVYLARQLAELGRPDGYPQLLEVLAERPSVTAIEALAAFVPLEGRVERETFDPGARLLAFAASEDPQIRQTVLTQLGTLQQKGAMPAGSREVVQRLATSDQDPNVRAAAAYLAESLTAAPAPPEKDGSQPKPEAQPEPEDSSR